MIGVSCEPRDGSIAPLDRLRKGEVMAVVARPVKAQGDLGDQRIGPIRVHLAHAQNDPVAGMPRPH